MNVQGIWRRLAGPRGLVRGEDGGSALEFAIVAPMIMLLGLGAFDTTRVVMLGNKVNRVAANTADMVTRNRTLQDGGEIATYFDLANNAALPLDLENAGRVFISGITNADGTGPRVAWQRTDPDYGLNVVSRIGSEGAAAVLPGDMTVRPGETAVVSEVFYEFTPTIWSTAVWFSEASAIQFYRPAFFRPRFGGLETLE